MDGLNPIKMGWFGGTPIFGNTHIHNVGMLMHLKSSDRIFQKEEIAACSPLAVKIWILETSLIRFTATQFPFFSPKFDNIRFLKIVADFFKWCFTKKKLVTKWYWIPRVESIKFILQHPYKKTNVGCPSQLWDALISNNTWWFGAFDCFGNIMALPWQKKKSPTQKQCLIMTRNRTTCSRIPHQKILSSFQSIDLLIPCQKYLDHYTSKPESLSFSGRWTKGHDLLRVLMTLWGPCVQCVILWTCSSD